MRSMIKSCSGSGGRSVGGGEMLMKLMRVMGRQSSLLSYSSCTRLTTWNKIILIGTILIGFNIQSSHSLNVAYGNKRELKTNEPYIIKSLNLSTTTTTGTTTTTTTATPSTTPMNLSPGRTNSRFLKNFPPYDFLNYGRRNGISDSKYSSSSSSSSSSKQHQHTSYINGNSPVFYIRLPPAPYVFLPGLGYVSPHPYNTNSIGGGPSNPGVMMSSPGLGNIGSGLLGSMMSSLISSKEQSINNNHVISLPLKFLSNGRPSQIQSPNTIPIKKLQSLQSLQQQPPKKNILTNNSKGSSSSTSLISGGKYSFNGKPNGVFIVRSPVVSNTGTSFTSPFIPTYIKAN